MANYKIDYLGNRLDYIDEVADIWVREWASEYSTEKIEAQKERLRTRLNVDKAPFVVLAIGDNGLQGTSALLIHDLKNRTDLEYWLGGVYTKPEYRLRGIAKDLISYVVDRAKSFGLSKIYLKTAHAQKVYQKLGWTHLEKTHDDDGSDIDIYYLELDAEK